MLAADAGENCMYTETVKGTGENDEKKIFL